MTTLELKRLPENINLKKAPETRSCQGIQLFYKSFEFCTYNVYIIKSQWTKTQKAFSIRIDNFYSEKNHMLQIPMKNLKQCLEAVKEMKEKEVFHFWTRHTVKPGKFIKEF